MTGHELVIVGDALLDVDIEGTVERLAQDEPVAVLDEGHRTQRPGGAALAAAMAAADGVDVTLVSAMIDDDPGLDLRQLLAHAAVEVVAVPARGVTPEKIRLRTSGRTLLRLDRGGKASEVGAVPVGALELIRTADVVLVSDYGRGMARSGEIRRALRQRRRPTVWDPHPRGAPPIVGATLVTPNIEELAVERGAVGRDLAAVVASTEAARASWQALAVATTRGPEGAVMSTGPEAPLVVPGRPIVGDPCGAGDRFAAAVAVGLHRGMVLAEAVTEAVRAAEHHVAGDGRATSMPRDRGSFSSEVTADELITRTRTAGGTVVVAGGCFDVLHAGHAALLEGARRLGDALVVAINSDASVRRLKGPGRPAVPANDRAAVLRSLSCVDAVVTFEEDDPIGLLRRLRPDVFVKGGDYADHHLPEAAVMGEWGGQAVVLPYLTGRSSTRLLQAGGLSVGGVR